MSVSLNYAAYRLCVIFSKVIFDCDCNYDGNVTQKILPFQVVIFSVTSKSIFLKVKKQRKLLSIKNLKCTKTHTQDSYKRDTYEITLQNMIFLIIQYV